MYEREVDGYIVQGDAVQEGIGLLRNEVRLVEKESGDVVDRVNVPLAPEWRLSEADDAVRSACLKAEVIQGKLHIPGLE